jgi:uncharacterized membrane protein
VFRSNRVGWIAGGIIAILIFAALAAIGGRQVRPPGDVELAPGESEILHARVLEVVEEGLVGEGEFAQPYQRLRLRLESGSWSGQELEVEQGLLTVTNQSQLFATGDRVLVEHLRSDAGQDLFLITDHWRSAPLLWLTLLFVAATLLLSRWQGLRSLLGMAVSLAIIVWFIVPQILAGRDPVFIAVAGSVVMMSISLYLVYGWRPKTHVAVTGLFLSLVLTGLLAAWFVGWARLSGFGSEEASFLQVAGLNLDTRGLLLAGIIIGTLGALDDIAIGQSSALFELSSANPRLTWVALLRHGMIIGRDHIAAMVNTLLLAYVGAALPLVLLISANAEPLGLTLNRQIIAEEIVRTLVGSLGLLAGVPLTTLLAATVARRRAAPTRPVLGDGEIRTAD